MLPAISYGKKPAEIILIHGGPAAPGNISVLADKLAEFGGVLQPRQDEDQIDLLLSEMFDQLDGKTVDKAVVIGHSFGAWIGAFFASKYPDRVSKLVLLGTGPLGKNHQKTIHKTRLKRLNRKKGKEYQNCLEMIHNYDVQKAKLAMRRLKKLTEITDQFKPIRRQDFSPPVNLHNFKSLSEEMNEYRKSGKLVKTFSQVQCPVSFIHGAYDPHPVAGFIDPLDDTDLKYDLKVIQQGGHELWMEMNCADEFYQILGDQLN